MCTSASKKKPSSRRPCVCKKGCMRVKRVAGDAGDCRGLSAERDPGGANFLTRKSLKTGVKNFKLFSLYGPSAIPSKFSVRWRVTGRKSPATLRTHRNLVFQHPISITDVAGDPRTITNHIFLDVHPPRLPSVLAPAADMHPNEPVRTCRGGGHRH
jgi:hypothetical protein